MLPAIGAERPGTSNPPRSGSGNTTSATGNATESGNVPGECRVRRISLQDMIRGVAFVVLLCILVPAFVMVKTIQIIKRFGEKNA